MASPSLMQSLSIPDLYTTVRIEDTLKCLSGAKRSKKQVLLSPHAPRREGGDCLHLPTGVFLIQQNVPRIVRCPSTFQWLIECTVGDMNPTKVLVYLHDIIVFRKTWRGTGKGTAETRWRRVKVVIGEMEIPSTLSHLSRACCLCKGVTINPKQVEVATSWPRPNNVTELMSFLRFCSYHRRCVNGLAKIARPLNEWA